MPAGPAGQDVFHARIQRIKAGKQVIGDGLDKGIAAKRRADRKARGRSGRGVFVMLLVCGGFGGAYASGQLPAEMNSQIMAWGIQAQDTFLGVVQPAAAQAASLVELPMPQG